MSARRSRTMAVAIPLVAGYLALQWLGRTYGSTSAERHRSVPGDDLIPDPQFQTDHATTIDAPPEHHSRGAPVVDRREPEAPRPVEVRQALLSPGER